MKLVKKIFFIMLFTGFTSVILSSCNIYKFRDVSVDPDVKTVKIEPFINQARYVNPQLTSRLGEAFQLKVVRLTKLTRTNNDDAHYQIGGYISHYDVTTAGISGQQTATNRLTVSVHITFRNTLKNTNEEYDVSRNFDFPASLSLPQAEAQLLDDIIRNMSDEIFNRIFSNW
jgi:hypothetical protein